MITTLACTGLLLILIPLSIVFVAWTGLMVFLIADIIKDMRK